MTSLVISRRDFICFNRQFTYDSFHPYGKGQSAKTGQWLHTAIRSSINRMTKHQVDVAAESLAASLLSQAGYEVFVQYGANQPGFDLVAIREKRTLRVSVKGTQVKGWCFSGGDKEKGITYAEAADKWLTRQNIELVFVFVQFYRIKIGEMPDVYVARPHEVSAHVKRGKGGAGDSTLRWNHTWTRGIAKGITDTPQDKWKFTQARIDSV
jgi:Holliday junction resolvase-like predicted endonuclease